MLRLIRDSAYIWVPIVLWHPGSTLRYWGKHLINLLLLELPLLLLIIPLLYLEL
jgi:hypothetical protein